MDLIVVDTETTGLDPYRHVVIEVAAVNVRTGKALAFVPFLPGADLAAADAQALGKNRYFERGTAQLALPPAETRARYEQLWEMLKGNRLGGANARFDAEMLRWGYARTITPRPGRYGESYAPEPVSEPWHYRLADLGSYAAPLLQLSASDIPGLSDICGLLGVKNHNPHTAAGDASAAAECFRKLEERAQKL